MILSQPTNQLVNKFGHVEAIRMIAQAGFDAYDMSLFEMFGKDSRFNGDNYREYARSLREKADSFGIVCNQAHAPFGSSSGDPEDDELKFGIIVRSMEIAAILGAKIIVVHPCQHFTYADEGTPEILRRINLDFYKRLIPYCEKFGIKVACENMWQWSDRYGKIVHSTCSRPEEFVEYIDMIGSEWIVACLDIGHAALLDVSLEKMIRMLGAERLQCLHVHDVDGHSDLHTLPYMAKIDWESVMKTLGEIGYKGDLTFEAGNFHAKFPNALQPAALRFMCETGRHLITMIK
ncbi:MAG: sugar phosphate isomerase/epimerase [Clostridia bacterium]|nr:sugar phosphate isomerase/epimerase [Clostridia bacterium]